MNINWKARLKNKSFIIFLIVIILLIASLILSACGVTISDEKLASVVDVFKVALGVLAGLGVINDPTTENGTLGLSDSSLAMTYEEPKTDATVEEAKFTQAEVQSKIQSMAYAEVGYLGHASAAQLDDATANQSGMYTKYARDLDSISYFNGAKQGFSWCCVFICWLYYQILGKEKALEVLGQPSDTSQNWGAGCKYLCGYLTEVSPHNLADCQVGDVVCYDYDHVGSWDHVGIIAKKDSNWIYVIQGNNGNTGASGGVAECIHGPNHNAIKGIYRPHWDRL